MWGILRHTCRFNISATISLARPLQNSHLICDSYFKNSQIGVREFSTEKPPEKFLPIYKFKEIQMFSAMSKLKIYQAIFTCIAVPTALALESNQTLPEGSTLAVLYAGLSLTIFLTSTAFFSKNTIGIIYVTEDLQTIKLSILNFWGNRKEILLPANEWVPLSELPGVLSRKFYLTTMSYNSGKNWKLFIQGEILDKEKFDEVIGIL